ncbi:hypothetical protein N0V87_006912 [Didymella glomerata]|uniref:S-Me-THD N-terminal domain-containing protein n=1 Tax=Didymella glomerata TaxID=749621 RepID=A0A9W9BXL1_9PLEO|nr:hypothetical protein N0V87_006912 [Didymella glomerata]
MEELSQRAIDTAVTNGALRDTVTIAEMESYPLQYIANKSRIIIKAVGDLDHSHTDFEDDLPTSNGMAIACGGAKGSPQVSIEKPYGDEILESQRELYAYLKMTPDAVIPLEIGGGNGLQGLIIGASIAMNIPAIDED